MDRGSRLWLSCLRDRVGGISATAAYAVQRHGAGGGKITAPFCQTLHFGGGQAATAAVTNRCSDIPAARHSEPVLKSQLQPESEKKIPQKPDCPAQLGEPALIPGAEGSLRNMGARELVPRQHS